MNTQLINPRSVSSLETLEARKAFMQAATDSLPEGSAKKALVKIKGLAESSPIARYMLLHNISKLHPKFLMFTMKALGYEVSESEAKEEQGAYLAWFNEARQSGLMAIGTSERAGKGALNGTYRDSAIMGGPLGAFIATIHASALLEASNQIKQGKLPLAIARHYDSSEKEHAGQFNHEGRAMIFPRDLGNRLVKVICLRGLKGEKIGVDPEKGTSFSSAELIAYFMGRAARFRILELPGDSGAGHGVVVEKAKRQRKVAA